MQASEILSKAADLIEPEGKWVQGAYSDGRGAYCMLGALDVACNDSRLITPCMEAIRESINFCNIAAWNDAHNRIQAEVVSALRKAANLAKEQENR